RAQRQAGVVDQQVDAAEVLRQRLERGAHRIGVADVERGRVHLAGAERVHQRLQPLRAPATGDHAPAAGDEALHRRAAETGAGAGDERDAAHFARIAIAGRPPPVSLALASASSDAVRYGPMRTRYTVWPRTSAGSTRALSPSNAMRAFSDSASEAEPNAPACST